MDRSIRSVGLPLLTLCALTWLGAGSARAGEATVVQSQAQCQESGRCASHLLGAGLALSLTQVREDLVAPLRMVGPAAAIAFGYRLEASSFDLQARLRWGLGVVFDRYDTTSFVALPALEVALGLPVTHTGWGALRLGGAFWLREALAYLEPWDDSHFYWIGTTGVGPRAELRTHVTPGRDLSLALGFPVLAFVSRPPRYRKSDADNLVSPGYWHDRFADDPRLTSLNDLISVFVRAEYRGSGRGFRIDPWAELEVESAAFPRRMTHLSFWLGALANFDL